MDSKQLQKIEEKLAFLEHAYAELEGEVFKQQGEIESLKLFTGLLQEKLDSLIDAEDSENEMSIQNPPHY